MLVNGDKLIEFCGKVENRIVLISPFVKLDAIRKVLNNVPDNVHITLISRFLPKDIANGVCDLSAARLVVERSNSCAYFNPSLHAKIYIFDNYALAGSANLTSKGMGWAFQGNNVEILLETSFDHEDISCVYRHLAGCSLPVDVAYLDCLMQIQNDNLFRHENFVDELWVPSCKKPEVLWSIYSENENDKQITSVTSSAKLDLKFLDLPEKIDNKEHFEILLKSFFLTSTFFKMVRTQAERAPLDDSDGIHLINSFLPSLSYYDGSSVDAWKAAKSWIRFCANDLVIEAKQEVVRLAKRI